MKIIKITACVEGDYGRDAWEESIYITEELGRKLDLSLVNFYVNGLEGEYSQIETEVSEEFIDTDFDKVNMSNLNFKEGQFYEYIEEMFEEGVLFESCSEVIDFLEEQEGTFVTKEFTMTKENMYVLESFASRLKQSEKGEC